MNVSKTHHKQINRTKIAMTLFLGLLFSVSVFAQRMDREKIKALKIAHITEQLDLTKTEAQKFWPVYNANESAKDNLRDASKNRRKEKKLESLSEAEAKTLLLDIEEIEQQKMTLQSKYLNDLLQILPAKKIIKLYHAEHSFRQKMFEEYKKRHANDK
ncbi:hypothetical protein [Winogradskyella arenosi]|uniref:LTXXQ motif family protein n=1 Tax=Winogradskyella arenosi TaxID=533325 RepID=A0A368ZEU8_9FLAO|nr:hypothetical protein [Winogradskyella arenosi]RCW91426.1 hypothetical protein DFQ08_103256 [Winogradskyella arenosi]